MGRSHTIIRAVGTTLTRSDTVATMNALAVSILALFQAGGTYDLGIDRAWVQWDGTDLDVVLEDDAMSAVAADLSARNTTIANGLNSLDAITSVNTANIETWEQSALAVTPEVAIGVVYAADSWDEHWENPTSLPSGWATDDTGAAPDTAASYPAVGDGSAIQLDSDSDGKAMISKTFASMTSATTWELRTEIKLANIGSSTDVPLTIRDGARRILIYPTSTGLALESGTPPVAHALTSGDWLTYTVRRVAEAIFLWAGPHLVGVFSYSAMTSDTALAGQIRLGNSRTAARTATIRRFSLRTGSVNEAPPEYTMRGTTNGR